MVTVWILFSIANDYNQPNKAFEQIYWEKPTIEMLKDKIGFILDEEQYKGIMNGGFKTYGTQYWIESFKQSK